MVAKSWLLFVIGIFCSALAAAADDTLDNDGTWRARIDVDGRNTRLARVVISEFAGHWQETGPRRASDPCSGTKPFPLTVQKSTNREVEFTVFAATVRKSCSDFALTLRVVDERTLAGTTSDGQEVRLTREPAKRNTHR